MNAIGAVLGALVVSTALAGEGAKSARTWSFDADEAGAIAKGFTNEAGEWKVAADPTAPSKGHVLAQGAKNSGATFNLTLVREVTLKDIDLSVKLRAVAGEEDQGGGLVWRAKDARNYYVARYNPLEDNYRVYKIVDGRRKQLGTVNIPHTDGWHTLRVTMRGDRIVCYYDGVARLDVRDQTFAEAGAIGLWTKADAVAHFDDLTAQEAGEPAAGDK